MVRNIIELAEKMASVENPGANFYIPKDTFIDFLYFHFVSFIEYRNLSDSDSSSLHQYLLNNNEKYNELHNKEELADHETSLESNIYRTSLNRFNSLNEKTMKEAEARKQNENRAQRYSNTVNIFDFQIELEKLLGIKADGGALNTTYKRITQNNVHNISFSSLMKFNNTLLANADEFNEPEKLLHYYMIEKGVKFFTLADIATRYEKMKDNNDERSLFIHIYLMVFASNSPILYSQNSYFDLAETLDITDENEVAKYQVEILSVTNYLKCIIGKVWEIYRGDINKISITEQDKEWQLNYLRKACYRNDYKLKKDFSADSFKVVMQILQEHNQQRKDAQS